LHTEFSTPPVPIDLLDIRLSYVAFALALVVFAVGAWDSPLFNQESRARVEVLNRFARAEYLDEGQEKIIATSYWSHYTDVAADPFFGREGRLGIWGAREHFKRHGKREGRVWPGKVLQRP